MATPCQTPYAALNESFSLPKSEGRYANPTDLSKVSTSTNTTEATSTYKPFHRKLTSIGDRPTKLETVTTFAEAGQSAFPIAQLIDKTSAA